MKNSIDGILEAIKIGILKGMKEGGVVSGRYTVYFRVVESEELIDTLIPQTT